MDKARVMRLLDLLNDEFGEVRMDIVNTEGLTLALEEAEDAGLVDRDDRFVYLTVKGADFLEYRGEDPQWDIDALDFKVEK